VCPVERPAEPGRAMASMQRLSLAPAQVPAVDALFRSAAPAGGVGRRGERCHRLGAGAGVALQRPQAGVAALTTWCAIAGCWVHAVAQVPGHVLAEAEQPERQPVCLEAAINPN
jgi:hypothetical protein